VTSLSVLAQATTGSTSEVVLFVVFAGIAIGAGIGMVAMRNIVHGALMLVINLLSLAGLYLLLQSSFLSIVQIIVYAGAIMVLFLFVIMLLGIDRDDLLVEVSPVGRGLAVVAGLGVVAMLGWGLIGPYTSSASVCDPDAAVVHTSDTQTCAGMDALLDQAESGSVEIVATDLFTRWTFPFEASALLLIVATLGAMLLGRRHDTDPDDDPAWEPSMRLPDTDDTGSTGDGPVDGDTTEGPAEPGDEVDEVEPDTEAPDDAPEMTPLGHDDAERDDAERDDAEPVAVGGDTGVGANPAPGDAGDDATRGRDA